jgi:ribosomal protein S18 acetylase RimI-like enzyme
MFAFSVVPISSTQVPDADLEALLRLVYVGGGFTEPSIADSLFRASNVRQRGELLVARDFRGGLFGLVVTVLPGSPACRFATRGEAELQLLCVHPEKQRHGIGSALIAAAINAARGAGATRMILWTQSSMTVAQRLYVKYGFERVNELDFSRGERSFQVFARQIDDVHCPPRKTTR